MGRTAFYARSLLTWGVHAPNPHPKAKAKPNPYPYPPPLMWAVMPLPPQTVCLPSCKPHKKSFAQPCTAHDAHTTPTPLPQRSQE